MGQQDAETFGLSHLTVVPENLDPSDTDDVSGSE